MNGSKVMRPFLVVLAVALIFFLTFYILTFFIHDKEPAPAPDLIGPRADGSVYSLSENFGKQGVALIFFELEHRHSQEAMENIVPKAKELGVPTVAVCVSELSIEESQARIKELKLPAPDVLLFDVDGKMAKAYNVDPAPCSYFLDKKGMLRDAYPGPISAGSAEKELREIA